MKKLICLAVIINLSVLSSCMMMPFLSNELTHVVRWTQNEEILDSSSNLIMKYNIFNDFLWTTPLFTAGNLFFLMTA